MWEIVLFLHDLYMYKHCFLPLIPVFVLKCCALNPLVSASQPLLLFTLYACVLASPAHLHMPQLFTHCLPTIICVTLISIVYVLQTNCFMYLSLCITLTPHDVVLIHILHCSYLIGGV